MEYFSWAMLMAIAICVIFALIGIGSLLFKRRSQSAGGGSTGSWLPLAGLCVAGVVGLGLIVMLTTPRSDPEPATPYPLQSTIETSSGKISRPAEPVTVDAGEVWRDIVDEQFAADIYPSARIATKALALQIAVHVKFRVLPKDAELSRITIGTSSGVDNEDQYATVLAERLRAVFDVPTTIEPGRFVMPEKVEEPGHILVDLSYPRQMIEALALAESRSPSAWDGGSPGKAPEFIGLLKATIKGGRDTVVVMSQFIDKPWVDRFDEFASSHPDRKLLLIRTPQFATSPRAAELISDDRAVDAVTKLAMPLMRQNFGTDELSPDLKVHVRNTVRWLVNSGVFIEDRFVQKLKRPYGEVWRAAALVEVKPAQLETLKVEVHRVLRSRHQARTRSATFLGGAVVAAIVFLLTNWFAGIEETIPSATVADEWADRPGTSESDESVLSPLPVESPNELSQPESPAQPKLKPRTQAEPLKQAKPPDTVPETD